jgi:LL-diaminopimelate aminotransferase
MAHPGLFDELGAVAERHELLACHDHAYAELAFGPEPAPSALASPAFRARGIEVLSLSKTWSIPGWRVAFAVGDAEAIAGLHRLKTQVDAGMFPALQRTAAWALRQSDPAEEARQRYRERRDAACAALAAIGMPVEPPAGGMYLWVPVPTGEPCEELSVRLLDEAGVVVTPGTAYGAAGRGHVRIALTVPEDRLLEAVRRIGAVL